MTKTFRAAELNRENMAMERKSLKRRSKNRKPVKAVFIDESGVTAKMTRLYGRTINPPGRDGGFAAAVNLLKTVVCERLKLMDARFLPGGVKAAK